MNRGIVILGGATLAFGSASAYLYNDLRETRAQAEALQVQVAELQKTAVAKVTAPAPSARPSVINPFDPSSSAAPQPTGASIARPVPMATFGAVSATGATVATAAAPSASLSITNSFEQRNRMLENPEYREAMKRQQRLMLPRMYPDLQAALQLSEHQADQLFDVLAEQQMSQMTGSPPPFKPGAAPDPAAIRDWQAQQLQLRKDNDTAIANVLGENGLQQWQDYQNSMPARSEVRQMRSEFETAGISLRQDQADQLLSVIAAEQKRSLAEARAAYANTPVAARTGQIRAAGGYNPEQMLETQKQQQQNVRNAVSSILTSQQMRQLERMHAQQLEMQEVSIKMNRAMRAEMEARGNTNVSPNASIGFTTQP
jgi:hypothetical protein